jgi:starvation-inducible DNA-binding protein
MYGSSRNAHPHSLAAATGNSVTDGGIALLDELLTHTIAVRDLYRYARHRVANKHLHYLLPLFEGNYKDQLRLVDVLVDRMRALGGGNRVVASAFVVGIRPTCAHGGRMTRSRLLCDLLDAHELVLSAVHISSTSRVSIDQSATHDFAVEDIVLSNELQVEAVREQLLGSEHEQAPPNTSFGGADACE